MAAAVPGQYRPEKPYRHILQLFTGVELRPVAVIIQVVPAKARARSTTQNVTRVDVQICCARPGPTRSRTPLREMVQGLVRIR